MYLAHHGIKGQQWGVRRFQNEDRTWTEAGKARYNKKPQSKEKLHLIKDTVSEAKKIKSDFRTYLGNKTGHYKRNELNTNLPKNDADAKKKGWVKLTAEQSAMHQNSKQDGVLNSKWVSPDGHKEVVFTGKGKNQHITSDVRDEGTYNYSDPNKNPLGHTIHDVLPYIFLGNEANDPTTTVSRLYGSAANFLKMEVNMDPEKMSKGKKAVYNAIMVHADNYSDELYHHGIKGQKWGIRRYQNEDGSYTLAGKMRYNKYVKARNKFTEQTYNNQKNRLAKEKMLKDWDQEKNKEFEKEWKRLGGDGNEKHSYGPYEDIKKELMYKNESHYLYDDLRYKDNKQYKKLQKFNEKDFLNAFPEARKDFERLSQTGMEWVSKQNMGDKIINEVANKFGEEHVGKILKNVPKLKEQAESKKVEREEYLKDFKNEGRGYDYYSKTKNGVTYVIDHNKNAASVDTIKDIDKNLNKYKKDFDKELINYALNGETKDWFTDGDGNPYSKDYISKNMKLSYVEQSREDSLSPAVNIHYDDGPNSIIGGHSISFEYDPSAKKKKYDNWQLY